MRLQNPITVIFLHHSSNRATLRFKTGHCAWEQASTPRATRNPASTWVCETPHFTNRSTRKPAFPCASPRAAYPPNAAAQTRTVSDGEFWPSHGRAADRMMRCVSVSFDIGILRDASARCLQGGTHREALREIRDGFPHAAYSLQEMPWLLRHFGAG
jgi:hypothetical protein